MFKDSFFFGTSLSGFQFEMGNGKDIDKNTDWYVWAKDLLNAQNGIVSGDDPEKGPAYWDNYEKFHNLEAECGMNMIRLAIEWSRIFPIPTFSASGEEELSELADKKALSHYRKILENVKSKGLTLMINLSHFTIPLWLHDPLRVNRKMDLSLGGWADKRIVKEFEKFAGFISKEFSDIVDYWSTMNEPAVVATLGYTARQTGFPPSIISEELFGKAIENQLKAHLAAFEAIKRNTDNPVGYIYAFSSPTGDKEAVDSALKEMNWRFTDIASEKSDFIGINYYSRIKVVKKGDFFEAEPGFGQGGQKNSFTHDGRITSDFGWEFYPEGLYNIIKWVSERYNKPIFITENGIADSNDSLRPYYLISHLHAVEKALNAGFDVKGYLHWSLTDNFEWAEGYRKLFGLIHVNFETKELTPRPSYYIFKEIIKEKSTAKFENFLKIPYNIWDEKNLLTGYYA